MKNLVLGMFVLVMTACSSTKDETTMVVEKGVSLELAAYRKATISNINYALHLTIPEDQNDSILTKQMISLTLADISQDLQFDFMTAQGSVTSLVVNGDIQTIVHTNEHLVIDKSALKLGENQISIVFYAGDTSLNRNPEYLYTVFVPDRARTAFPIFDQPNLKATYDLTLDLPKGWTSIANGPLQNVTKGETRDLFSFEKSDLIPTYLFTFVAGKFETIIRDVDGVDMTMLHRETDQAKVLRNLDEIFRLHKTSLDWLEDYTGIPYPFKKFGFALIPSFQFGGMEHVGAIHYRASSLFLDEQPSIPQQLNRANLIAHETAHMWFGDLVTMDWFNDVWTKEVFANFMASKIVNPSFPDVDHDLNFLLRSYPSAYSVDRTEGANPIRQHLPNLNEAGTMYGNIIYNKAPIMMMQLEMLIGKEMFQKGLQQYLKTYAFDNASWPDLVAILDKLSDEDLLKWSEVWVNTSGRPTIDVVMQTTKSHNIKVTQKDPLGTSRIWPQSFSITLNNDFSKSIPVDLVKDSVDVNIARGDVLLDNIILNSNGKGYGLFPVSKAMVTKHWNALSDVQKGAVFVTLYEQLLENTAELRAKEFLKMAVDVLNVETNPLLVSHVLSRITHVYWTLISVDERKNWSTDLANTFWRLMETAEPPSLKKVYFEAFSNIATDEQSLLLLKEIWAKQSPPEGFKLSEQDYINLSADLAIKLPNEANYITRTQLAAIKNPDSKRHYEFVLAALSSNLTVRDEFILSLGLKANRQIENWVLTALKYIHHPLRIGQSQKYIQHGLDLLQEIQITGDIFFPGRWMEAILSNHRSDEALATVRGFLDSHPDYNYQLKLKILQSADPLFRANKIIKERGQVKI
jgi:aminopeptidase N